MKLFNEMLQNLPYFWNNETQIHTLMFSFHVITILYHLIGTFQTYISVLIF